MEIVLHPSAVWFFASVAVVVSPIAGFIVLPAAVRKVNALRKSLATKAATKRSLAASRGSGSAGPLPPRSVGKPGSVPPHAPKRLRDL